MDTKAEKEQEKKNKRFSLIMSVIVHGSLLVLFLILVAWTPPDPPNTLSGLTFNLGVQDEGFGDTESETESQADETDNTVPPESLEETEETVEEVEEVVEPTPEEPVKEPVKEVTPPVEEVKPVEPVKEADPVVSETVEATETQKTESEVKVEDKKEETPKEEPKEEVKDPVKEEKVEEKPKEEPKKEEPKEEPKKEEPKEVKKDPVVNKKALLGSKKSNTKSDKAASSNQGDKADTRGQMGKPNGDANTKGNSEDGGNLGPQLSLDGWDWDDKPSAKDDSEIDGIIRFRIKVDETGRTIEAVKLPGTTISDNTVVEFYRKEVMKLTFHRTVGEQAAPISVGEIRFIIKTK